MTAGAEAELIDLSNDPTVYLSKIIEELDFGTGPLSLHEFLDNVFKYNLQTGEGLNNEHVIRRVCSVINLLIESGADPDEVDSNGSCFINRFITTCSNSGQANFNTCLQKLLQKSKINYLDVHQPVTDFLMKNKPRKFIEWVVNFCSPADALAIIKNFDLSKCTDEDYIYLVFSTLLFDQELFLFKVKNESRLQTAVANFIDKQNGIKKELCQKIIQQANLNALKLFLTYGSFLFKNKENRVYDSPLILAVTNIIHLNENQRFAAYKLFDYVLEMTNKEERKCAPVDQELAKYYREDKADALYFVTKFKDDYMSIRLLQSQASLTFESICGVALDVISPKTLEKYFNTCINYNLLFAESIVKQTTSDKLVYLDFSQFFSRERDTETELIKKIAKSRTYTQLICHPLVSAFIFLKWQMYRRIFILRQAPLATTFLLFLLMILNEFLPPNELKPSNPWLSITMYTSCGSYLLIAYIFLVELFWAGVTKGKSLLPVSFIITFFSVVLSLVYLNVSERNATIVFGFYSLLVSVNITLLLFFIVSDAVGIYLLMAWHVTVNTLKALLSNLIIIFGFILCFYAIFGDLGRNREIVPGNSTETDPFRSIGATSFKTFLLSTGEIDVDDIQFEGFRSYLSFIVFVTLIPIVLMNLINGLAVDDIQNIRKTAEYNCLMIQLNYLVALEDVIRCKYVKFVLGFWFIPSKKDLMLQERTRLNKVCLDISSGKVYTFCSAYDLYTKCSPVYLELKISKTLTRSLENLAMEPNY